MNRFFLLGAGVCLSASQLCAFDWAVLTTDTIQKLTRPPVSDLSGLNEDGVAPFALIPALVHSDGTKEFFKEGEVFVDLGGKEPSASITKLRSMTLVGSRGFVPMRLTRFEKRFDIVCRRENDPQYYYVGAYKPISQPNVGDPYVALLGSPTISDLTQPTFVPAMEACAVSHYRLFTIVKCIPFDQIQKQ